jgi:opacity protein-like surface antigen
MNLKLLTAAAVLSTAIAAPAVAQDVSRAQVVRHHESPRVIEHRGRGFWPADVAAGVVGGAIGTAGAIATAPFRSDRYAYNDGYYQRYRGPNGFACQPSTAFRGEDGRMHLCQ